MVGFGVSYKSISSFNVCSRGTNTISKARHIASYTDLKAAASGSGGNISKRNWPFLCYFWQKGYI